MEGENDNKSIHNEAESFFQRSIKTMSRFEQYAEKVLSVTSKFNYHNSHSYAPTNVIGKYVKYPEYGDFAEAYCLRSYGKWWVNREAYQKEYMPQDVDPLASEDYLTVEFETAVIPRDVCVYETYNPGAIVRIWGKLADSKFSWVLLWEGAPQVFPEKSRKFHINVKNMYSMIKILRLEFNQSHLRYHTSIEAILLGGYTYDSILEYRMVETYIKDIIFHNNTTSKVIKDRVVDEKKDYFSRLPYEVMLHIFQYLDLKSLTKCAVVNKRWNMAVCDPILYQNLSLKRYWSTVNGESIDFFLRRCRSLRKLDLSWCGNDDEGFKKPFKYFLVKNKKSLTHLSLSDCYSVNNEIINIISFCTELEDLRLKNTTNWHIPYLTNLNKLVALDLTNTLIDDNGLRSILISNPHLKHIIIDLCQNLRNLDEVVSILHKYNKNLETWSSWKTMSITSEGVRCFSLCPNIKDLDLGWCLLNIDPGDSLFKISEGCRKLTRLVISGWRCVNDQLLSPIIENCKNLHQLDLIGMRNISSEICSRALVNLPGLRLLDISYCNNIKQDEVDIWRQQFPHITIQRSC